MRHPQYTLTRDHVHAHASYLLRTYLRLRDYGNCCPVTVLLTILLAAAARLSSIFATCKRLLHAPSYETVRQALLSNMPAAAELLAMDRLRDASGVPFDPATTRGNMSALVALAMPLKPNLPPGSTAYNISVDATNFAAR